MPKDRQNPTPVPTQFRSKLNASEAAPDYPIRALVSGQSEFAAEVLKSIAAKGHQTVLFICTNREMDSHDAAEKVAAELGVPFVRAQSLDESFANSLGDLKVDIGVMAYVTLKAHYKFLSLPMRRTIQYHPSLLPKYRGPSAINWAIINGENVTGFTIFSPNEVLDDGEILFQMSFNISEDDSAASLYRRALMPEGVKALVDCMEKVVLQDMKGQAQDSHQATYQSWCTKQQARIFWGAAAHQIHNLVRGCDPKPGAWFTYKGDELTICKTRFGAERLAVTPVSPGQILQISERGLTVKCGDGAIELLEYRNASGSRRPFSELISKRVFNLGDVFDS